MQEPLGESHCGLTGSPIRVQESQSKDLKNTLKWPQKTLGHLVASGNKISVVFHNLFKFQRGAKLRKFNDKISCQDSGLSGSGLFIIHYSVFRMMQIATNMFKWYNKYLIYPYSEMLEIQNLQICTIRLSLGGCCPIH